MQREIQWTNEEFLASLRAAVKSTSAERAVLACRAEKGGWRYRQTDPLRPLFEMPSWGVQEDANWRWHHQSLALLSLYTDLHVRGAAHGSLDFACAVVRTWREESDDPAFSWGEHSTPLRLERLVRAFGLLFDDLSDATRSEWVELIGLHAKRLRGDVAVSHHNHALDQIYALLLAKRYLPFLDIPEDELAARLTVERDHLLSREGVVTENSPGYQSWIPARVAECQRLLTGHSDDRLLADAAAFTAWIARPDGTWPELGDTAPGKPVEAVPPAPAGCRVFPDAGYAVNRGPDHHFVLKCGFRAHAHRHADDGTFLLHAMGEDWFIEAGMFGYAKGWERDYARSPAAHNISYRPDANVIRSTTSRRWQRHHTRWGLRESEQGIVCRSFMFDDAIYDRRVEFSPGRIVLHDSFDNPGSIKTRFHVPDGRVVRIAPGRVTIDDRLELLHDLPEPVIAEAYRTVAYMRYGPAQAIEFTWPADRTRATFEIVLPLR